MSVGAVGGYLQVCADHGCDPATGACTNPAKANGTSCDDGNPCTTNDACQDGVCDDVSVVTPQRVALLLLYALLILGV